MIEDSLVIALITFIGLVLVALIGGAVTLGVQLTKWHATNQMLWAWNRDLIDQIYRGEPPPPRRAPDGLFD